MNEDKRGSDPLPIYRFFSEHCGQASLLLYPDLRIVSANRLARKSLGYSEGELAGRYLTEIASTRQEDTTGGLKALQERLSRDRNLRMEVEFTSKGGDVLAAAGTFLALDDQGGRIAAVMAFVGDTQEREGSEDRPLNRKELLDIIFDSARDSIFVKDRDLRYIQANTAMEELFEMPAEELMGKTDEELFGEEAAVHINDVDHRVIGGESIEEETTKPVKGIPHTFHVIKVPVRDSRGTVVGLCGIARDITGRKRAEKVLRESEHNLKTLFNTIEDMIFVLDYHGGILWVNSAVIERLGYPEGEIYEMNILDVHPPSRREEAVKTIERILAGERPKCDLPLLARDGATIPVETRTAHGSWGGRGVIFGISRDTSERKLWEKTLLMSLHLENLILNISTDFINAPSDKINGGIDSALERLGAFTGIDCSYIFQFREGGARMDNTHEWCAEGIKTCKDDLQDLESDIFPWWMEKLRNLETIHIPRVEDLPPEARQEKELLRSQGIRSLVVVPLASREKLVGFLGFDAVRDEKTWRGEIVALLRIAGDIIINALERKRVEEELEKNREHLEEMVEERTSDLYQINELLRHEIAERRRAEAALGQKEKYYRSLVEKSWDAIAMLNEMGLIVYASPSLKLVTGYEPDEVIGKSAFHFVHPADVQGVREVFAELTKNPGASEQLEYRFLHKNGTIREHQIVGRNLLDNAAMSGVIINFRDITERKQMQERVERINRLFLSLGADLIENMERIVATEKELLEGDLAAYCRREEGRLSILTTAPGEDGFMVIENWEDMACSEVISRGLIGPYVKEELASSPFRNSDPLVAKFGYTSFLGYPVWCRDDIKGCLGIYLTGRRRFSSQDVEIAGMLSRALSIEEERLAYEENLKDFIDIASHELRHPLTIMKGYSATLRKYGERLDMEDRDDILRAIETGADRLNGLVKELLDISRIERGRFVVNKQPQLLESLIQRAIGEMREKGIANGFRTDIPEGANKVMVDKEKMIGVLVNLLDNAVGNSAEGSDIEITASQKNGIITVSVLDRGTGIPEKDRERIFDRFYQVGDAIHHSSPGMGIGLYISREIVESHGGEIWCEPREEGGSVFRFTLPGTA
ncbi:MAG: PAS domain S-box protein [Actinomycetota bacterium]|nr:PAS domain S-box protein [Actinomycetota bacterium]